MDAVKGFNTNSITTDQYMVNWSNLKGSLNFSSDGWV